MNWLKIALRERITVPLEKEEIDFTLGILENYLHRINSGSSRFDWRYKTTTGWNSITWVCILAWYETFFFFVPEYDKEIFIVALEETITALREFCELA